MLTYQQQVRSDKGRFGPKIEVPKPATFIDWLKIKKSELNLEFDYQLAELLSMPPENLSRILAERSAPSALHLQSIFTKFKIKPGGSEYYDVLELAYKSRLAMELRQNRNKGKNF